jgi:hypothetical protein
MHTRQSQLAGAMHPTNIMGKGQIIPWHNLTSGLAESTTFFLLFKKFNCNRDFGSLLYYECMIITGRLRHVI